MSLSESFDPNTFLDGLPLTQPWVSGGSLPVPPAPAPEMTEISPPYLHWQDHLLPLSCVSQEDNLTVLRLELETAHQLLQYQQAAIDTLSEQLTNRDLTLQHTQDELSTVQQTAHQQTSQITELGAICRDLKMQLRRQQQRVLQYRDLLKTAQVESYAPPSVTLSEPAVSFGYDSITIDAHSHKSVSKSPPVTAWSAPESIDLTGPLACYRELATIRMTTTRIRLETKSPRPSQPNLSGSQTPPPPSVRQTEARNSATGGSTIKVELPSFTKTSS